MKSTKMQFAVLCAMVCPLFLSQSLIAEESYKRFTARTWMYRDGTEATGKFISVSGPTVTLRLEGKGTVRVALEDLSVKDLNWIYEYHKRKKQLNFLPPQYRKPQTESKPGSETSKPAETEAEKTQPEKKMTAAESETDQLYKPFLVREWTLKSGIKHQAKLLSVSQGKAMLLNDSGQGLQIQLDQLSDQDLAWVIEYYRRNNLLDRLPAQYRDRSAMPLPVTETAGEPSANPMREDDPDVIKANTEIDPALVAALREYRVWSDKKGQKSEAILTIIDGREVIFATRFAGIVRVHIGTLIEEDLQLLRDALKMHGRFDEIPLAYREPTDPGLSPVKLKHLMRVNFQRKWTDLSGNSVGASYVKMEDGNVTLLITKTSVIQEFPYLNFIPEDQEYVQERLKKEIPGHFFPEEAEVTLTPEERENGFRIWTDRKQRQIKGKYVRLAYGDSVVVLNTGSKEELFITTFFSDQDLSLIKPGAQKQTGQLAMNERGNPGIPGALPGALPGAIRGGMPPGMGLPGGMNPGMTGRVPGAMSGGGSMPASKNRAKEIMDNMRSSDPGVHGRRPPGAMASALEPPRTPANPFPRSQYSHQCPICNENHTTSSPLFSSCPHCGVSAGDRIYTCTKCSRKFQAEGHGNTAPCPHCNSGISGINGFRLGKGIRGIVTLVLIVGGFIFGGMKLRG